MVVRWNEERNEPAKGKGKRAARTWTAMRVETAPQTIHSSVRPKVPFDRFIQGFKAFPRARPSWLCLLLPPFSFFQEYGSRAIFPSPPFLLLLPSNPSAAQCRCPRYLCYPASRERNFLRRWRIVQRSASNIPVHRVSPSRSVFPERDTFWLGALLARSGSLSFNRVNTAPFRLLAQTKYVCQHG